MAMMISKFHKLVSSRKVWTAFAILISVAFVIAYTGGKSGKQKRQMAAEKEVVGKLYGKNVSRVEFGQAYQNVYLLTTLRAGQAINPNNEQVHRILRQNAWQRLAVLRKASQMGLTTTDEQVANTIRQQPIFRNQQTGQFDRNAYDDFFRRVIPGIGLRYSSTDFQNMIRENLLIDKVSSMAIQGALVTDAEVERAFHVYTDKLTVQYASIPRSMAPAPEVTEEDAKAFYSSHPDQFIFPNKVKVRYVEYPVADYLDQVDVTDDMVTSFYENYKSRFVVEGTETNAVPQYQTIDEARDTIVSEIKTALARRKAATDAGVFVSKLSSQSATFDQLAQEANKTITATPPFAKADTVRGIDPTAAFTQAAFSLDQDANHYYSDPVVGKDSIYILVLTGKMQAFLPDYEIVAGDAMKAAKADADEQAYIAKAETVHAQIEAALKAGTSFADAATQAGLKVSSAEPFSLSEPPTDDIGQRLLNAVALFDQGTLVDLIPNDDELLAAYVAQREAGEQFKSDGTLPDPNLLAQPRSSIVSDKAQRLTAAWQDEVLKEAQLEDLQDTASDNS